MSERELMLAQKARRHEAYRTTTAATLRDVAQSLEAMADALEKDDGILGSLAGQGLANHLPALPKNVRDTLAECLTDEAAAGYRADLLYFEAQDA